MGGMGSASLRRSRGLSLTESLAAITLLSLLTLSVMSVYAASARSREHGANRARSALALGRELGRATVQPGPFLTTQARAGWVTVEDVPEEYGDRTVSWRWQDDPSGLPELALVRVRVIWREPVMQGREGVAGSGDALRSMEGAVLVERP